MRPEPTIPELLDVASKAVHGTADKTADYVRGSDYESLSGPNAILWSRQAQRDTDLFRAIRFNEAEGDDLTRLVRKRFGIERYLDTRGQGTAVLVRPTSAGGQGTVWKGTRIRVSGGTLGEPRYYRVTQDSPVESALSVAVPIEALVSGPTGAIELTTAGLFIEDPLWDSSWTVQSLVCGPGRDLEPAGDFRARVRTERRRARVGHTAAIIKACKNAGAGQVAAFRSDYGGDSSDYGLNVVYVGDLSYTGSADLVRACTVALRAVRVAGDCMQVLPMARATLTVDADVYLNDSPAVLPINRIESIHRAGIIQQLGGSDGGFTYSRTGIMSAIVKHTPEVQDVSFVSPGSDVDIMTGGTFPHVLNRYTVSDADIVLRYHGP